MKKIERVEVDDSRPLVSVKIVDSGEFHDGKLEGTIAENGKVVMSFQLLSVILV